MAARTNSSWAPCGPRSRSRPSLRMRFRCANRISIFLRLRRDVSKPSVPANDRAMSRACSCMSRGILRDGSFGQHCGLSGHTSQSSLLARYKSVLPSCTVPLVLSRFPPGSDRCRWSDHIESRCARRYRHLASTCRTRGYVARCPSPRPASSASELVSSGPLGCGIGRRDELRHNVTGGAPRLVVEGCQILLHPAA
jgi:hypothetical protein